MASIPHVALLIETSRTYTRNILRGVKRYISEYGPWSVFLELRALDSRIPPWLRNWRGDGILCRSFNQATVDAIEATGAPAVELRASKLRLNMPFVGVDSRTIGRLVAGHFLERGFRNFGCYEIDIESFFEERRDSFLHTLKEHGFSCHCYRTNERTEHPTQWERHQAALLDWIQKLPKPIAIMACTDQLGFWLIDACNRAGLSVPEEVAVVGVEDDESLCEMASPPMSSVHLPGARVGYEAAKLLDHLMAGGKMPIEPLLIPPMDVVTRNSSDILAIDDPAIAKALTFIRERASTGIKVDDVVTAVGGSRSKLERKMRKIIGRTPQEEIMRVKLNLVRQLLVETPLSLEKIALRAGFAHTQYMAEIFRSTFDTTPGQFRKKLRLSEL
jgi:LacI family transcriptional regulator